jgi:hypothetical protein
MAGTEASEFGCNLDGVQATAAQLSGVHNSLEHFDKNADAHAGDIGSSVIQQALQEFYDESSDQREKITGSVGALASMLQGVYDGVVQVDNALAGSLPDIPPAKAETTGQHA